MSFKNCKRLPAFLQNIKNTVKVSKTSNDIHILLGLKRTLQITKKNFSTSDECNKNYKYDENLAVVLQGITNIKVEKRPIPSLKENQVLLQMETIGICGTDMHMYQNFGLGNMKFKKPVVLGHEGSGLVLICGKNVTDFKIGDRVAVEPVISCRKCSYCKNGHYNLCPNLLFCGTPSYDGNLCRYFVHDSDFCHKLPENMDFEDGSLVQPLAVGVHTCRRGHITSGDLVLIFGSGAIGLLSLLAAKTYGASQIMVLDVNDFKLKKAIELGANYACNIEGLEDKDIIKLIHKTLGDQPNKTLECSGFEQALRVGIYATKSGGKVVLTGIGKNMINLPISEVIGRELDVLGVTSFAYDYPIAIDMIKTGKINPKPLITHRFNLEECEEVFKKINDGIANSIKVMIQTNSKWKPEKNC